MSRLFCFVALVIGSFAAGCASAPEATPVAATGAGTATDGAAVAPSLVLNAIDPAPESAVRCRDMLKQGSNVIVTRCMTIADWERFERHQIREAQEMLRALQGSAYR